MVTATAALAVIGVILYLVYLYLADVYKYWRNRNVAGPKPIFPLGNTTKVAMQKKTFVDVVTYCYNEYPEEKMVGFYDGRTPVLIIRDVDIVKQVLIKDFNCFRNRGPQINKSPLSDHLFNAENERWRLMRQKFTPIFSTGKLKGMFHLMNECVQQFQQYLEHLVQTDTEPEIRELMVKFSLKAFGSCVLGVNMSTLNDGHNIFSDIATKIFQFSNKRSLFVALNSIFPGLVRKFNIKLHNQDVVDFFLNLVKEMVKERAGKPKVRRDFMDFLLELKEQSDIAGNGLNRDKRLDIEITEEGMAAQTLIFYAAGFDGPSGITSFLLHELVQDQGIQERIYQEIRSVTEKYGGVLTYDALQEMIYLDMVFAEALRKYTLNGVLIREAAANYTFPGTNVSINKGIKVVIPIRGLHNDPKYFPNPDKFDPERFARENLSKIQQCSYLPFGDGPRNCIAMRFARMQSMLGIASLLHKYKVVPSARTKHRLSYNSKALSLESEDGIWLKIQRRQ